MGCPAKKVCNQAAGSALLRDEALVARILRAAVAAVTVPVTVKIRTGWSPDRAQRRHDCSNREDAGVASIAVHGRTRACRFVGAVEYDTVAAIKAAVTIPVFANGDIGSVEQARRGARPYRRRRRVDRARGAWRAVVAGRYRDGACDRCAPACARSPKCSTSLLVTSRACTTFMARSRGSDRAQTRQGVPAEPRHFDRVDSRFQRARNAERPTRIGSTTCRDARSGCGPHEKSGTDRARQSRRESGGCHARPLQTAGTLIDFDDRPLHRCVENAMNAYFAALDGEDTLRPVRSRDDGGRTTDARIRRCVMLATINVAPRRCSASAAEHCAKSSCRYGLLDR